MYQVLESLSSGETEIVQVRVPAASSHSLVVETRASVISVGTEGALVEFERGSQNGKTACVGAGATILQRLKLCADAVEAVGAVVVGDDVQQGVAFGRIRARSISTQFRTGPATSDATQR